MIEKKKTLFKQNRQVSRTFTLKAEADETRAAVVKNENFILIIMID
jgi:hypothetical protein